jgi:hypothetical protein
MNLLHLLDSLAEFAYGLLLLSFLLLTTHLILKGIL